MTLEDGLYFGGGIITGLILAYVFVRWVLSALE